MQRLLETAAFGVALGLMYALVLWAFARVEGLFDLRRRKKELLVVQLFYGAMGLSILALMAFGGVLYKDFYYPVILREDNSEIPQAEFWFWFVTALVLAFWLSRKSIARRWRSE